MKTTDEIIESLVCPPPPSETSLNEDMISRMIVPAPNWNKSAAAAAAAAAVAAHQRMDMRGQFIMLFLFYSYLSLENRTKIPILVLFS